MKKFLSILLALAVGFTFTFGSAMSAFAAKAPGSDKLVTYDQAVTEIKASADTLISDMTKAKNDALYSIFKGADKTEMTVGGKTVEVTKTSVEAIYDKAVYNPAIEAINSKLNENLNSLYARKDLGGTTVGGTVYGEFSGYFATEGSAVAKADDDGLYYPVYKDLNLADTIKFKPLTKTNNKYEAVDTAVALNTIDADTYKALFANGASSETHRDLVAQEVVKAAREAALTAITNIDLAAYSKEYNNTAESNYDKASKIVTTAYNAVYAVEAKAATWDTLMTEASVVQPSSPAATYYENIALINAIYKAAVNQADPTGAVYTGEKVYYTAGTAAGAGSTAVDAKFYDFGDGLNAITKIADEPTEAAKLEWAKNKVSTELTATINKYYADTKVIAVAGTNYSGINGLNSALFSEQLKGAKADAKKVAALEEAVADAKDQNAAAIEVLTYMINDCDDYTCLIKDFGKPFNAANAKVNDTNWGFAAGILTVDKTVNDEALVLAKVKKVAQLKKDAELAKASIGIDGTTSYDIDTALKNRIDETYKAANVTAVNKIELGSNTKEKALLDRIKELASGANNIEIGTRTYTGVAGWNTVAFEKGKYDEVMAVKQATIDALYAAKTIDEADAAFLAGLEKFNAIPTKADKAKAQATKEFKDLLAQYKAEIKAYIDYKKSGLEATKAWKNYTITSTEKFATDLYGADWYNFDGCYTVDELKTAYANAKTEIDNLKAKATLETEKKALEERAAAVPTKVTVADKETVATLKKDIEDFNAYVDLVQGGAALKVLTGKVDSAYNTIKAAEAKAIKDAYTAIMKYGKVTTDEADAVKALREAVEAYKAFYKVENEDATYPAGVSENELTGTNGVETLLSKAAVKAVEEAIAKLPADGSDPAAVKAAREAYNALTLAERVSVDPKYYDKLVDAEKMIKFTAEDAKAYVQDLSIAVRTAKVGKKVKVTVKADVQTLIDNGYTVTYKFYKSTKKGSGYKNTVNKTTNTYTNTNPVKGKNYYKVKLVVKNADGTVVATTPLTQCKYGVRTIK